MTSLGGIKNSKDGSGSVGSPRLNFCLKKYYAQVHKQLNMFPVVSKWEGFNLDAVRVMI